MMHRSSVSSLVAHLLRLLILQISVHYINGDRCDHREVGVQTSVLRGTPEPRSLHRFSSRSSSFKIALFADLHYGEDAWTAWGPLQDVGSTRVMDNVLDFESPDFVVYLGDLITANNLAIANASLYWDQAISPTRSRGIPWASVFGNHDDAPFGWPIQWFSSTGIPPLQCPPATNSSSQREECNFEGTQRLELMESEIKNKLSYSRIGPTNLRPSISNYVLQVTSSDDDPRQPIAFLYFLDSGGGSYPEVISSAQAAWFEKVARKLNPDLRIPEIIFWHIPSKAFKKAAPVSGVQKPCVGSINIERVAPQEAEMGIMKILTSRPSVKGVFVGHNHGLDWCCPYEKLWLCFARHTGYGGYGDWPRGARILEIMHNPFSIKSWVRMEDGQKHSELILSDINN
ncbi:hypothetical protein Sjap_002248 [Stephania japonica]|uniref:Calcineurin-like phosphoesterase domain-containing protein n=1 Tax=Stephania japonica TaxID=461633 RepID=A0AAP0KLK4_9MAGN